MRTCELIFESGDTIKDYNDLLIAKNYNYIVAKVPRQNISLVHELEETGFRFMEAQFTISVSTGEIDKLGRKWGRIIARTGYEMLNSCEELEYLLTRIRSGMFKDDRITLDENFGEDTSVKRYVNWITDIFNDDSAKIYFVKVKESRAGFFVIKRTDNLTYHALIAGIFKEFQGQGLPLALFYYYLKLADESGAKQVITSFSSNNWKMLNSFTRTISFKVQDVVYVLRKTQK